MWQDKGSTTYPFQHFDLAVIIGRFQPVHDGHIALFQKAASVAKHTLVLVGSSHIARNCKNPFTFEERRELISKNWPLQSSNGVDNFWCLPLVDDLYNDARWTAEVQAAINGEIERMYGPYKKDAKVCIVGHYKDDSSYYLDLFPAMVAIPVDNVNSLGATEVRDAFYKKALPMHGMPTLVKDWLTDWSKNNAEMYEKLSGEDAFIKDYKSQFSQMKFPPVFITADAVVINKGHILLVKRRSHPGKGLWALPGGFLNQQERIEDAITRELYEETKIGVDLALIKASLKGTHVFDAPNRSLRGRTVTHAGLIILNTPVLPKIKGSDDAEKARWVPLAEFYNMSEELFEDHHSIGLYMINRVTRV